MPRGRVAQFRDAHNPRAKVVVFLSAERDVITGWMSAAILYLCGAGFGTPHDGVVPRGRQRGWVFTRRRWGRGSPPRMPRNAYKTGEALAAADNAALRPGLTIESPVNAQKGVTEKKKKRNHSVEEQRKTRRTVIVSDYEDGMNTAPIIPGIAPTKM